MGHVEEDEGHSSLKRMEESCRPWKILDVEEVLKYMEDQLEQVEGITQLPRAACSTLLDYYQWDIQKLTEDYYDRFRQHKVLARAGVTLDKTGIRVPVTEKKNEDGTKKTFECSVCVDEVAAQDWVMLDCGHAFCCNCWEEYLRSQVMGVGASQNILCMQSGCKVALDTRTVLSLLPPSAYSLRHAFHRLVAASFVQRSRFLRWCPGARCEGFAVLTLSVTEDTVVCKCGWEFCFRCMAESHQPLPCHLMSKWEELRPRQSKQWVRVFTKNCPVCKVPIEKNGGCLHMICTNPGCGLNFCWNCMKPWHSDNYECTDEAQAPNQKKLKEMESYTACVNACDNHQIEIQMEPRFKEIINKNNIGKTFEVERLHQVLVALVRAHRILIYSYIFSFFIRPSTKLDFLQFKLSELEQKVQKLTVRFKAEAYKEYCSKGTLVQMETWVKQIRGLSQGLVDQVNEGIDKGWWLFKNVQ